MINNCGQLHLNAPPIGLPQMGAKFYHTLNILLVGHRWRRALSQLYFKSSVVGQSVAGRRSVHNKGCWALGGFPPKGNILIWGFPLSKNYPCPFGPSPWLSPWPLPQPSQPTPNCPCLEVISSTQNLNSWFACANLFYIFEQKLTII
jgi:hypothetical protein